MLRNVDCVIVDDEQDAIELLSARLNKLYKNITIVSTFTQWEIALEYLKTNNPDILFMDISMPGKSGLNLLKLLPNLTSEIIFVTAFDNYALNAFSYSASGYILKPVDDLELSNAVDKAIQRVNYKKKALNTALPIQPLNEKIGIPNGTGTDFFHINDIFYLESSNKCTFITTRHSKLVSTLNIGKFQFLVEQHQVFFQVHRSFIVNLNHISRYESIGMVIMSDKKEIPVSRNERSELANVLNSRFGSFG